MHRIIHLLLLIMTINLAMAQSESPNAVVEQSTSSTCDDIRHCRTIWSIVWSCLATIFTCTWVSLHLNVPGQDEGRWTIGWRRLKVTVLALLAPEVIVLWAMRQWMVARDIAKEHKLSITHGFCVCMGGFTVLTEAGSRPVVNTMIGVWVTPDQLSRIKVGTILDKSKGDLLSKALAVLQTGWFMTQCIARRAEGLHVTELEIVAAAFATLNLATYLIWLNKPLDVREPFRISGYAPPYMHTPQLRKPILKRAWKTLLRPIDAFLDGNELSTGLDNTGTRRDTWGMADFRPRPITVPRVPTLWAGELKDGLAAAVGADLLAFIYGGIHCIAWTFEFPTPIEQMMWRVSSVIVTVVPIIYLLVILPRHSSADKDAIMHTVVNIITSLGAILYILARIVLLTQAFVSLRSLPGNAHQSVRWTTLLPHI